MFLKLLLKGFVVGIAFIIPGVSGGTLAIYLGVYKRLLKAISHIFDDFKNSFSFLFPFVLGALLSVLALAKVFGLLIEWNSFIVLMFFIGLLAGGIKHIYMKAKVKKLDFSTIFSFIIAFVILMVIVIIDKTSQQTGIAYFDLNFTDYLLIIALGAVSASTMIVPGISGSAILMVLGFYTAIVTNVIGNVLDVSNIGYNVQVLALFLVGVGLGIILFSKLITHLLETYPKQTYFAIIGLIIASMIGIFLEIRDPASHQLYEMQTPIYQNLFKYISDNIISVIGGLLLLGLGYLGAYYLTKIEVLEESHES